MAPPPGSTAPASHDTSAPSSSSLDPADARAWLVGPHPSSSTPPAASAQPLPQSQSQPQSPATHVTASDLLRTIKPGDFLTIHQTPCARPGFLTAIGSGGAMFMLRWVLGAAVPKAANWGVGAAFAGAIGGYEVCQYRRRAERERVRRMVEIYQEALAEQRAKEAARKRREAAAEAARVQKAARLQEKARPWYRAW